MKKCQSCPQAHASMAPLTALPSLSKSLSQPDPPGFLSLQGPSASSSPKASPPQIPCLSSLTADSWGNEEMRNQSSFKAEHERHVGIRRQKMVQGVSAAGGVLVVLILPVSSQPLRICLHADIRASPSLTALTFSG